eukprot:SRR837773.5637.p1 GENE.SRR837773.5637~~SRR837773.5637.p1  ORF type:complete len:455 (-),score=27.76 SRR837773.5637:58-1371(-)
MSEFPAAFAATASLGAFDAAMWNPEATCDGSRAEDRARWCVEHLKLSPEAARQRVMSEYPRAFVGAEVSASPEPLSAAAPHGPQVQAHGGMLGGMLGGFLCSLFGGGHQVPAAQVPGPAPRMQWNPEAVCDGTPAEARAQWCVANLNMPYEDAKRRVMGEYPQSFDGCGALAVAGANALGAASQSALQLVKMPEANSRHLIWSDEFTYEGPPDPSKWDYDIGGHGWGNNELQHYTSRRENAWVGAGALRIRAIKEHFGGNEFTSARLVTKGKADWKCGRVEMRIKVPSARGSWAAAWMLPTDAAYGQWPRSGEIDIMEHVGMDLGQVHGTVHTEKFNHLKNTQVGRVINIDPSHFHTYAIEWHPDKIVFMLDDHKYHEFRKEPGADWEAWPFDRPFHIIMNVAVGGAWGGQKGVDDAAFAGDGQVMEVAWVRVYRLR